MRKIFKMFSKYIFFNIEFFVAIYTYIIMILYIPASSVKARGSRLLNKAHDTQVNSLTHTHTGEV